jgi:lipopolysaccharide export system permease protein
MNILQRYILALTLKNVIYSLLVFCVLFSVLDFFDRIDNVVEENASFWTAAQYFIYKLPLTVTLMLPVAMLLSTLFTFGILSKNSEITAMRAAGLKIYWIARPMFAVALGCSLLFIILSETVVPYSQRRVREIYNIDIRKKDARGSYSQEDFWWRDGNKFFSIDVFDSRTNEFQNLSRFELSPDFKVLRRTDALSARWIDQNLGWDMRGVKEYEFDLNLEPMTSVQNDNKKVLVAERSYDQLPLPITQEPKEFYDAETDPHTMSYSQLKRFMQKQAQNGINVKGYLADLYSKIAFPFSTIFVTLMVIPFCLRPARSGSMAGSILIGLVIGFGYYAINSFSIAIGRAELWPPLLAAWMANILLLLVGFVLSLGAEAP